MHAAEREKLILDAVRKTGFVSYRNLETALEASPATIRRDLTKLEEQGAVLRVHGGVKAPDAADDYAPALALKGTPFDKSIGINLKAKQQIGKAAAAMCASGDGIIIDGGTTTYQMCDHLADLDLQVLTNSLHIVNALLPQERTRILVPSGALFREQNIILAAAGEESMPRFFARRLFMGASSINSQGVLQSDVVLVASQRRLIERADEVVLMVDSSKFSNASGAVVCGLDEIDIVICDSALEQEHRDMLTSAGVKLHIAS